MCDHYRSTFVTAGASRRTPTDCHVMAMAAGGKQEGAPQHPHNGTTTETDGGSGRRTNFQCPMVICAQLWRLVEYILIGCPFLDAGVVSQLSYLF